MYRAIVLSVGHAEPGLISVSVRYIDYGNEEEGVLGHNLYSWDPLLEAIPPQAIRVRLRGVSDSVCLGSSSFSKEQVGVFRDVMLRCSPFSMVVSRRLQPESSVFCHNSSLPGPEVEISLASRGDTNIVTTLASYSEMSGVFNVDLSIGPLPGPFQASPHLNSSSPFHPSSAFHPSMPTQVAEEKVSSWLEGLHSADQVSDDKMVERKYKSTVEELPMMNKKTSEDLKQEEEPMLIESEGDNQSIGSAPGGNKQNVAITPAPCLEQQVVELSEDRQFKWLLAHLANPGEIWLHPLQDASFCLGDIEESMFSSIPQQIDCESNVPIGSCWAVPVVSASFPPICTSPWVRVRLERDLDDCQVSVRSIDYGVLVDISKENLHHLPPGLASAMPGTAVCCSLAGVLPPNGGWTEQATAAAFGMLNAETVRLAHVPELQNGGAKLEVVLSTLGADSGAPNLFATTINGELLQLGHALPDKEVSNALLKNENWEEELETWDPIALAYHNTSNNYITNDNDLQMATQGYKSKNTVCQFFKNRDGHCWKGEFCQDKHQLARKGAVTADIEEVMVGSLPQELPSFPPDCCGIRVLLLHAISPSSFYLRFPNGVRDAAQLSSSEQQRCCSPRHEKFRVSLAKFYEENPKRFLLSSLPAPGSLVVVKKDNVWERALVLDEDDAGEDASGSDEDLRVFLVDEGKTTKVCLHNMRYICCSSLKNDL